MDLFANKLTVSEDIKEAFFGLDSSITEACDLKATEICRSLFPDIDLNAQENIDLVIRPMSAVMALNELLLQNFFSFSSIDGVYTSKTLPSSMKVAIMKNFANLNGFVTSSVDPDSLYTEITFFLQNNTQNRSVNLTNEMFADIPSLKKLMFIDGSQPELTRSEIPYIQIEHTKLMNFKRSDLNPASLIDHSYNREDYQAFQEYKAADTVTIPGSLDVYFHAGMSSETISVIKGSNNLYHLPEGYYVAITSPKLHTVTAPDDIANGFVKYSPRVLIVDGDATEDITVVKYDDPSFDFNDDQMLVTDILTKGFYPLFIDLTMYSKDTGIGESAIIASAEEYLESVGWSMDAISLNDLQMHLNKEGFRVAISPKATSSLMFYTNGATDQEVVFPITMADLNIPVEVSRNTFSKRTISVILRSVNVIQE